MKQKTIKYTDLSKNQLQVLKDLYIQNKVECKSHKDLKDFVQEIITHQINDTIGEEEEVEAWTEMSNFYGNEFESIVLEIQQKYAEKDRLENFEEDTQARRVELLEKNSFENEKKDMWDD